MSDETEAPAEGHAHWDQRPALGPRGMVLAVVIPVLIAAAGFGVVSLIARDSETAATAIKVPTGDWILIGSDPQGAEFALVGAQ